RGIVAAFVAEYDLAIELEPRARESRAVGQTVDRTARGPSPFSLVLEGLRDRLGLNVRADSPKRGWRAQGREVTDLAQIVARAWQLGELRVDRRGPVDNHHRQAVGRRYVDAVERDQPAGTGTILDDHRRAQGLRQIRCQHPRIRVVSAAGTEPDD